MKKSLVLAMAMALGVTASAYAANPFSDVPAGHWAYDSISKLAAAGVIEGYGDDTFRGDRLMTRYEMAQIVAKAMAKGANVDKLAAEFADELDALGVRVAALEKKSDNVKITGTFRYHYQSQKLDGVKGHTSKLRSRITFTGKVNDNWEYVGMLENQQDLTDNAGNEGTDFQRAYLQGRLGGLKTVAGRLNKTRLAGGDLYGTRMDGIDFTYGDKIKINAYYGKPTNAKNLFVSNVENVAKDGKKIKKTPVFGKPDEVWGVNASADLGKYVNFFVGYDQFKASDSAVTGTDKTVDPAKETAGVANGKDKIFDVGLTFKFAEKARFTGTYLHAKLDDAPQDAPKNGFILAASYGGATGAKVGSWGIGAKYYHNPAGSQVALGWESGDAYTFWREGAKGFHVFANYAVAKNMVFDVEYWDLKSRVNDKKNKVLWTALNVNF